MKDNLKGQKLKLAIPKKKKNTIKDKNSMNKMSFFDFFGTKSLDYSNINKIVKL